MPNILCLSTSSKIGSLSLFQEERLLNSIKWSKKNSHAELCATNIAHALDNQQWTSQDIDYYVCDIGPGSFTGIRVAASTIKSLAYAHEKPIVELYSNDLLAFSAETSPRPICTIINALRSEFYVAFYEMGKKHLKRRARPRLMKIKDIEKALSKKHLLIGDGAELFLKHCSTTCRKRLERPAHSFLDYPQSEFSITYALRKIKLNKTKDWKNLEPLYIRASSAEEKLREGALEGVKKFPERKPKS